MSDVLLFIPYYFVKTDTGSYSDQGKNEVD